MWLCEGMIVNVMQAILMGPAGIGLPRGLP